MAAADAFASTSTAPMMTDGNCEASLQDHRKTDSLSMVERSRFSATAATNSGECLSLAAATVLGLSNAGLGGARIDASGSTLGMSGSSGYQAIPFAKLNNLSSAAQSDEQSSKQDDMEVMLSSFQKTWYRVVAFCTISLSTVST